MHSIAFSVRKLILLDAVSLMATVSELIYFKSLILKRYILQLLKNVIFTVEVL